MTCTMLQRVILIRHRNTFYGTIHLLQHPRNIIWIIRSITNNFESGKSILIFPFSQNVRSDKYTANVKMLKNRCFEIQIHPFCRIFFSNTLRYICYVLSLCETCISKIFRAAVMSREGLPKEN